MEQKSTFIPVDLHKWLKLLAVENGTSVAAEHEKALREVYAQRQRAETKRAAKQEQPAAVAQ